MAIEHRLGAILAMSPRAVFPLRQRHAVDYVQPGLALVGDAAHTIHPLAGQGLGVIVILGEPTFPGCRITGRILGNLDMADDKGQDDKLLCVPDTDPRWRNLSDVFDVPKHMLNEIAHFFRVYKDLEDKLVTVRGWQDRATAIEVLDDARRRYVGDALTD